VVNVYGLRAIAVFGLGLLLRHLIWVKLAGGFLALVDVVALGVPIFKVAHHEIECEVEKVSSVLDRDCERSGGWVEHECHERRESPHLPCASPSPTSW
jgi:hypothetical protein